MPLASIPASIGHARDRSRLAPAILGTAAALAAAALANVLAAKWFERRHPPMGRFVEADGVRLHYLERGAGTPVVLLHGNVVTAEDFVLSGLFGRLAQNHRVIAFDRPGFGYSERPYGMRWTPWAQAALLGRAMDALGVERAVVVGHSWGALVAMALALAEPRLVRGLALLSGYYFPTARADSLLTLPAAVPLLGDVLRYTVSPPLGAALLPLTLKAMFSPLPIPERFKAGFPHGMAVRPWQIRAEGQDGTVMVPAVADMRHRYHELRQPAVIMAGTEDRIVDVEAQPVRLHEVLPHSQLRLIPGAGHMVHYAAPDAVISAIESLGMTSAARLPAFAG